MEPLLAISDLSAGYGGVTALKGVSLEVKDGETLCVLGANGAGKSTLLRTISGLLRPTAGRVTFAGTDLSRRSPYQITRMGVAHVVEGRQIISEMTVMENLLLASDFRRDRAAVAQDLDRVFQLFPVLFERRLQMGGTLSGGQQQMLAIGRGLVQRPRLLLIDEPSLGLAPKITTQIFQTLEQLKGQVAMVLVEQQTDHALGMADRACLMNLGRIVASGAAHELQSGELLHATYFGSSTI